MEWRKSRILAPILLILIFLYQLSYDKLNYLSYKYQNFEGVFIHKEPGRTPGLVLKQNNKESAHDIGNWKVYETIEPGDYIIKKSGTINYALIRGNDTLIFQPFQK